MAVPVSDGRRAGVNRVLDEPGVQGLLAPNPGPMTLDGTNTWIVGDPRTAAPVVVDPGPEDLGHLEDVLAAAGGRIQVVLLTHRHPDHSDGAVALAERAGCGVRAVDPAFRHHAGGLADGDRIGAGAYALEVVATPGHTDDSVSLLLTGTSTTRLLTGDTVLGRGTTVIAAPDGDLGDYLASLQRLLDLVTQRGIDQLLPGHGPVVERPADLLEGYLHHRHERLEQVRGAVRAGAVTADQVVEQVYADLDRGLWPAARQSVEAQLRYLAAQG